nr:TnsA-like heteromeric transposase endonuclease subunit [Streptomyces cahuitamycinicus]
MGSCAEENDTHHGNPALTRCWNGAQSRRSQELTLNQVMGTYTSCVLCLRVDFDPSVRHVVVQPFLLKAWVQGKVRKHIPDYPLLTREGPLVVDVRPSRRLETPEVAFTFAWTRQAVQDRGWGYQVLSEPEPALSENVRLLAGYRLDWLFPADLLDAADGAVADGMPREALGAVGGFAPELVG